MHRILMAAAALALIGVATPAQGQEVVKTTEWGSLTGKVTLKGAMPVPSDLMALMKKHTDAACCLNAKAPALHKVDSLWIIDPKSKAVANVVVFLSLPEGKAFTIHPKYKKRTDTVVIDQPFCAFEPRVSAINPVYFDGAKMVPTGQKLSIKNSAEVPHNIRATGSKKFDNEGFNRTLPPGAEMKPAPSFNPQPLPINLQCDIHTWMAGRLFVFDHPYYAITKADGTFTIPVAPAGAEIRIVAYHEGKGWAFQGSGEYKLGRPITLKAGKNTYDFEVEAPQENK